MWHSYADFGLNSCSVVRWLSHMASILPACTIQAAWSTGSKSPPISYNPATAASSWSCRSWVWCTPLAILQGGQYWPLASTHADRHVRHQPGPVGHTAYHPCMLHVGTFSDSIMMSFC